MLWLFLVLLYECGVKAHGSMNNPPSRNAGNGWRPGKSRNGCNSGSCMWFSQGCTIGCKCNEDNSNKHFMKHGCDNATVKEPTINEEKFRTFAQRLPPIEEALVLLEDMIPPYQWVSPGDWTKFHPWRAPGTAIPLDVCGLSGGSTKNNDIAAGFGKQTIVHKQGYPGSKLPPIAYQTNWVSNSTVEVAWGITANHGGGYQYRACPRSEELTEECFRRHVLPFVGNTSTLRWRNGDELEVNATRVTVGVSPKGKTWTKVPIPACIDLQGGQYGRGCEVPQFEPPKGCNETCWGFKPCVAMDPPVDCSKYPEWNTKEIPNIVDRIHIQEWMTPGEWVIQWRWDSEQTPQVWNSCGDVTIVAN